LIRAVKEEGIRPIGRSGSTRSQIAVPMAAQYVIDIGCTNTSSAPRLSASEPTTSANAPAEKRSGSSTDDAARPAAVASGPSARCRRSAHPPLEKAPARATAASCCLHGVRHAAARRGTEPRLPPSDRRALDRGLLRGEEARGGPLRRRTAIQRISRRSSSSSDSRSNRQKYARTSSKSRVVRLARSRARMSSRSCVRRGSFTSP
jgi:hypothetical protein